MPGPDKATKAFEDLLEADLRRLESAAADLACRFDEIVSSHNAHAVRSGSATLEGCEVLRDATVFLDAQLRGTMESARGVLSGMTEMTSAVLGLEHLLCDVRKVAQDVLQVEFSLAEAERSGSTATGGETQT